MQALGGVDAYPWYTVDARYADVAEQAADRIRDRIVRG